VSKLFTLGKDERIKSRKLIAQLFSEGKKFTIAPFRVYYLYVERTEPDINLKFGAGVSTKNFKKAVDRNRVRRLMKEAWRLEKNSLQEILKDKKMLAVFILYANNEIESFKVVSAKMKKIIDKLSTVVGTIT
jgi:ribonuclease P protein component